MKNKITVKEYIVILLFILFALMIVFLSICKIVSYAEYKEECFYQLEELKPGTYAIYNIVFFLPFHQIISKQLQYVAKVGFLFLKGL